MYFRYAFLDNKWIWFHILVGGTLAKILLYWTVPQLAFLLVAGIAISWEILEYLTVNVQERYGSKKHFYLDSAGDILGATLMALIVVW